MKLLIVSTWLPYPLDNGSRVRAYNLIRQLSKRHRVTLLSFGEPQTPEDLEPLRTLCDDVEVVHPVRPAGKHLGRTGLLSAEPRYYVQSHTPRMGELVAANLGQHDVALGLQVSAARYLAKETAIPRIFEEAEVALLREQFSKEPRRLRRWRHGLTWWKSRRFIRRLVDDFELTTVVSTLEREHLRAIGCDVKHVKVVPNGIGVPPFAPITHRTPRLIYPGSVAYSANLDAVRFFIREIFPLIRRFRPDLSFCVTGSTDGVAIDDLAAVDGVTFTGRMPEVDSLIAESAVCVVPLRQGGGTRLKVLQAMALATPVVSTRKGIEGLEVEPERHALAADSPAAFAAQVLRVLEDPALGRQVASEAHDLVRDRYSWQRIGDALEEAIEHAVREHARDRIGTTRL